MAAKAISTVMLFAALATAFAAVAEAVDSSVRKSEDYGGYHKPECFLKYEKCCYEYVPKYCHEYGRKFKCGQEKKKKCYGHRKIDWSDDWGRHFTTSSRTSVRTDDYKPHGEYDKPKCFINYEKCCYEYFPRYCSSYGNKYECGKDKRKRCYGPQKKDWDEEWGKHF
jgi:hypothetical protein